MTQFEEGYATPEEAARGDIPGPFVTVVGTRSDGDDATVWLLTNDEPPFEPYQVNCEHVAGRWRVASGFGGFGIDTPPQVLEEARRLGWR